MFNPIEIITRAAAGGLCWQTTAHRRAGWACRKKGAAVMKPNLGMKMCVWAIVGVLAAGTAWGQSQYGDGSIVGWGRQVVGADLSADFVAVAGGYEHSLGLKADGSIAAWGNNWYGRCNVPAPNSDFVAVAAGYEHSLGLKADGSIVAWGWNEYGQCDVPEPNTSFAAVAAGYGHSLGLKADGA